MKQLKSVPFANKIPPLIIIFLLVDIGLCLAYAANFLAGKPIHNITTILNLNGEESVCAWFSSIQFFCIAVLGMLYVFKNVSRRNRKTYLLAFLPLVFLLFSIDEIIQLHEGLGGSLDRLLPDGTREGSAVEKTGVWMFVLGIPFLAVFLLWAWSVRSLFIEKAACWKKIMTGMLIFLFGALCVEFLTNFVTAGSLGDLVEVLFEEGFELLGATVILWGVYDLTIEYLRHIGWPNG